MGMVNDPHGAWGLDALHQKTQISPSQVVRNTRRAGKAFGIKGVIAILLVHAAAYLINQGAATRSDEKATTLLRIGFTGISARTARESVGRGSGEVVAPVSGGIGSLLSERLKSGTAT